MISAKSILESINTERGERFEEVKWWSVDADTTLISHTCNLWPIQFQTLIRLDWSMLHLFRSIPGGIAKKFEYWMEKHHQDGMKLDMLHQMEKSVEKFARIQLKRQAIALIPEVQQRIDQKQAQHTRGKRKLTAQKEEAARAEKKAQRDVLKERGSDAAKKDE
jgi:hypothetical protein